MSSICERFHSKLILYAFLILVLSASLSGCGKIKGWTGEPVRVLVVMMKFNKEPNCPTLADCSASFTAKDLLDIKTPRHSASEYVQLMNKEINTYYQNASFGKMYFVFDLLENPNSTDGWWDAPYTLAEITAQKISFKQIAISIAYTALGDILLDYDRVIVISGMAHRGGQTCCLNTPIPFYAYPTNYEGINLNAPQADPPLIPMIVAEIGEGEADSVLISVTSHELGHMIGAPDQYYGSYTGMGHWDIMDFDPDMYQFSAWTRLDRGWIDWSSNTTSLPCNSGSCEIHCYPGSCRAERE